MGSSAKIEVEGRRFQKENLKVQKKNGAKTFVRKIFDLITFILKYFPHHQIMLDETFFAVTNTLAYLVGMTIIKKETKTFLMGQRL